MLEDGECAAFLSRPVFSVYVVRHMASRERAVGIDRGDETGSVSPDKGRHHLLCPAVLPKPIKPSQLFCEAVEDHRPYREKRKGTGFLVDPDVGETRSLFGHQRHVEGRIPTPFCELNGILILHTYPKLEMVKVPTNLSYRRRKSDPVR